MTFDIHIESKSRIEGGPVYQGKVYGATGNLVHTFKDFYPNQIGALQNALGIVAHFVIADGDELVGDGLHVEIRIYMGPRLEGMQELGDRNYTLLSGAPCGPDAQEIYSYVEEQLYTTEAEEIKRFLEWCEANNKWFGHGNYEQRFAEFKAAA